MDDYIQIQNCVDDNNINFTFWSNYKLLCMIIHTKVFINEFTYNNIFLINYNFAWLYENAQFWYCYYRFKLAYNHSKIFIITKSDLILISINQNKMWLIIIICVTTLHDFIYF